MHEQRHGRAVAAGVGRALAEVGELRAGQQHVRQTGRGRVDAGVDEPDRHARARRQPVRLLEVHARHPLRAAHARRHLAGVRRVPCRAHVPRQREHARHDADQPNTHPRHAPDQSVRLPCTACLLQSTRVLITAQILPCPTCEDPAGHRIPGNQPARSPSNPCRPDRARSTSPRRPCRGGPDRSTCARRPPLRASLSWQPPSPRVRRS